MCKRVSFSSRGDLQHDENQYQLHKNLKEEKDRRTQSFEITCHLSHSVELATHPTNFLNRPFGNISVQSITIIKKIRHDTQHQINLQLTSKHQTVQKRGQLIYHSTGLLLHAGKRL